MAAETLKAAYEVIWVLEAEPMPKPAGGSRPSRFAEELRRKWVLGSAQ